MRSRRTVSDEGAFVCHRRYLHRFTKTSSSPNEDTFVKLRCRMAGSAVKFDTKKLRRKAKQLLCPIRHNPPPVPCCQDSSRNEPYSMVQLDTSGKAAGCVLQLGYLRMFISNYLCYLWYEKKPFMAFNIFVSLSISTVCAVTWLSVVSIVSILALLFLISSAILSFSVLNCFLIVS